MTLPIALVPLLLAPALPQDEPREYGHSSHGAAFDEGPRQRPWRIEGIGEAPFFPITTSHPDVQGWFDQGNALLHSFWYYEAERAFRWCVKLDPDCAMAYWALSLCAPYDRERADDFLRKAVERKDRASERERRWIEAWEDAFLKSLDRPEPARPGWNAGSKEISDALGELLIDYPDDVEARAYYVVNSMFRDGRMSLEAVLQDALAIDPDHPGLHHYRIHNWDSIELGDFALDSCAQYGRIAPAIGHANHMPGHIYTKVGMWHEGAIWLDSATRVEKAYMAERLIFPFHHFNYAHNRNYLAFTQSMLGLPSAALQGARDLLNAPLDPDYNEEDTGYSVHRQGLDALRRTLVRFERWDAVLAEGAIPWGAGLADEVWRTYCEGLAHLGQGDVERAEELSIELRGFEKRIEGAAEKESDDRGEARDARRMKAVHPILWRELEGRVRIAKDDTVRGLAVLQEAADLELEARREYNDPPTVPRCLYNVLGEVQLDLDAPRLAIGSFEEALEVLPGNAFSYSGLARAHHALGRREEATRAYAHMLAVWSHAEPGVWQNEAARALGLRAEPDDPAPAPQRSYPETTLATLGPNTWQPYDAPELSAVDAQENPVKLSDFRGRNVLVVFYLSDQCVHCVEQLQAIRKEAKAFENRDTVLLAISSDPPERNREGSLADLPFRLLSDTPDHANAIRFRSYDEMEEIELHSTNLVDRSGRLRWARTGGDPFLDVDFLLAEIDRIEAMEAGGRLEPIGSVGPAAAEHGAGGQ